MTTPARLRLRITEKKSRRTYIAYWPWDKDYSLCVATGSVRLVSDRTSGYSEYNERGEPVLDSWIEPL